MSTARGMLNQGGENEMIAIDAIQMQIEEKELQRSARSAQSKSQENNRYGDYDDESEKTDQDQ